ncbi:MAG: class A beta-lactamase-related serine hydrolase [Acidobacteria bacterium]|nr:MAG: class A beta-lactamase-related serine hydrolase [Acidobacteriota bacterium]REK02444.1 MAG: class A beta-lactamase-related serine hydrolase [Acidobacteriota bacterium]REK13755.1 MAG: class A beta-lactamase-related serine hydrolase [Acidobacteriota bacterium]REK41749.1 MAG: class A beta-lactamase-related serine hydrolase [Acidobacteriota bacterium]
MSTDPIKNLLDRRIEAGDFASASWFVSRKGKVLSEGAVGLAVKVGDEVAATPETIYDLASLTKPLVTGLLFAIFREMLEFHLDEPVSELFEQFQTREKRDITFNDLLTHTSGFEAWRPFYLEVEGRGQKKRLEAIVNRIAGLPLAARTGESVIYSDLNFLLLDAAIYSRQGGLDQNARSLIFERLDLRSTCFNPPEHLKGRIAASEEGNEYEKQTAEKMGFDTSDHAWRNETIQGEVHDENCRFLGGASGHAGLFSTARETARIASQFLPGSELLPEQALSIFRRNLTPGLDQSRSAAFQLAATESSSAHGVIPDTAFGHLGFTGTMVWIDPDSESIYVLLTNRTHARRPPFADLSAARREFLKAAAGI